MQRATGQQGRRGSRHPRHRCTQLCRQPPRPGTPPRRVRANGQRLGRPAGRTRRGSRSARLAEDSVSHLRSCGSARCCQHWVADRKAAPPPVGVSAARRRSPPLAAAAHPVPPPSGPAPQAAHVRGEPALAARAHALDGAVGQGLGRPDLGLAGRRVAVGPHPARGLPHRLPGQPRRGAWGAGVCVRVCAWLGSLPRCRRRELAVAGAGMAWPGRPLLVSRCC